LRDSSTLPRRLAAYHQHRWNATISDIILSDYSWREKSPSTDIVGKFGVRQPHERSDHFYELSQQQLYTGSFSMKPFWGPNGHRREIDHTKTPPPMCMRVESDHMLQNQAEVIHPKQAQEERACRTPRGNTKRRSAFESIVRLSSDSQLKFQRKNWIR
jgi:hypothetical protein